MAKNIMAFVKKHPAFNATIHAIGGLGVGFVIAHYFSINLLLWGVILIVISIAGHIYEWIA